MTGIVLVVTFVSLSTTLVFASIHSGYVRAEMVLVINLAWRAVFGSTGCKLPGSLDGFRNEINGPVTRGNNVAVP